MELEDSGRSDPQQHRTDRGLSLQPTRASADSIKGSESAPQRSWDGETLFIKGNKSKYVNRHNIPTNLAYFPNAKLVHMETGHWCQAEKPNEFCPGRRGLLTGKTNDETQQALKPRSKA